MDSHLSGNPNNGVNFQISCPNMAVIVNTPIAANCISVTLKTINTKKRHYKDSVLLKVQLLTSKIPKCKVPVT